MNNIWQLGFILLKTVFTNNDFIFYLLFSKQVIVGLSIYLISYGSDNYKIFGNNARAVATDNWQM